MTEKFICKKCGKDTLTIDLCFKCMRKIYKSKKITLKEVLK